MAIDTTLTYIARVTGAARVLLWSDHAEPMAWVSGGWECHYCAARHWSNSDPPTPQDLPHADGCPWMRLYRALRGDPS